MCFKFAIVCAVLASLLNPALALNAEPDESKPEKSAPESDKTKPGKLEMTPANINKIIESSDIYGEQFRVNSLVQKDTIIVQSWLNPKSKDIEHDSKIDAVLIAKQLLDAFPGHNPTVKLHYFDRQMPRRYYEITVVPGVVKAFASGIMTEKDLLATLPMIALRKDTESQDAQPAAYAERMAATSPGYRYEDRGRLFRRMQLLEQKGVKASLVRTLFAEMDAAIGSKSPAQIDMMFARLQRAVKDLEDNYKRAQVGKPQAIVASGRQAQAIATTTVPGVRSRDEETALASVADIRRVYGEFYPEYGPAYPDRVLFADKLKSMKKNNLPYGVLLSRFRAIETMVQYNDPRLEDAVQGMYRELRIKPITRDAEYEQNQKLADLLKSRLRKIQAKQ
ncbi:MAG: hypothetical protein K2W82_00205 [Candidatus Obscuribacterales bacterium]|nr:hypothetical protein [Candidatus Obscuribacterales bacterium]